jgi:hypothetical protein
VRPATRARIPALIFVEIGTFVRLNSFWRSIDGAEIVHCVFSAFNSRLHSLLIGTLLTFY